jgi:hypothetical protein
VSGPEQPYQANPAVSGAPQQNGKAVTALVLGILGLVFCPVILSIAAIVIGNQAKNEIAQSGGMQTGSGLAQAGVVLGWVSLALTAVFVLAVIAVSVGG